MKPFEPFEFQKHDQQTLAENGYRALLAMEPGAGKTSTALLAHKNSGSQVTLVVAPEATHKSAWTKDAEWILGVTPRVIGNTGKAKKEAMDDFLLGYPGIYLVTPQLLTRAKNVSEWMGDLCIVDEGHQLNAPGKQGQKQMQKLADTFPMRLFLSGTAWRNNFERAWSVMRFLWPELMYRDMVSHDNRYIWKVTRMMSEEVLVPPRKWYPTTWERFNNPPEGYWRKNINGVPHIGEPQSAKKWLNESEPGRLLSEAPCVILHKKREACCAFHTKAVQGHDGFLPLEEPQIIEHEIELTRAQKKAIDELQEAYLTYLKENPLVVELPITMQQRIRAIILGEPDVVDYTVEGEDGEEVWKQSLTFQPDCKSPFADQLLEILEEEEDEPVVVYLSEQSFATPLVERLNKAGHPAFEFSGKTVKTRQRDLEQFGNKYKVAVIVISAGGTGVEGLQKVSKKEVWISRSVDETDNTQAASRLDRLGGRGQVQRHLFFDDLGIARGRFAEQIERQIALNKTLRKPV